MIYPGSAPASSPDLGHSAASVSSGHQPQAPSGHQGMMLAEGLGLASLGGQAAAYSAHNGLNLEKSVRIAHLYLFENVLIIITFTLPHYPLFLDV